MKRRGLCPFIRASGVETSLATMIVDLPPFSSWIHEALSVELPQSRERHRCFSGAGVPDPARRMVGA
jgi:hypothetical protein